MELSFQSSPLRFLRCLMQEVRFQEETAEIIIPDSYPDVASIADCCADAILRGKDCRDGTVTIAGGVKGVVLCDPEDSSYPRHMETYLPFSVKFEDSSLTDRSQVICDIRVCSADARIINSRKILLRVNLACSVTIYEDSTEPMYRLEEPTPQLQIKEADYAVCLPLETAEKSFVVSDAIEVSAGRPPIQQIYRFKCSPELTDKKLVGNKAVFRGTLRCRLLYLSENQRLYYHEQDIPFSQFCDLETDYDLEKVDVRLSITGYDVDAPAGEVQQQTSVSINLLAQCIVSGEKALTVIEDAYCTDGILQPQWNTYCLDGVLDQQCEHHALRQHISGNIREVLGTDAYWGIPETQQDGDRVRVRVPVTINVSGYDNDENFIFLRSKSELTQELALADCAVCRCSAIPAEEMLAVVMSDGVEVRCSVCLHTVFHSGEAMRTLCGGTVMPREENDAARPSLIVRAVEKDTALWDLAKAYGTTMEHIMQANHLEETYLPEDRLLLLPV